MNVEGRISRIEQVSAQKHGVKYVEWFKALPALDSPDYWQAYAAGVGQFLPHGSDVSKYVEQVQQKRKEAQATLREFAEAINHSEDMR
jgi:hypothetical protein